MNTDREGHELMPVWLSTALFTHHRAEGNLRQSAPICGKSLPMKILEVIQTLNQMQADGVMERYAIGGAVGATFLPRACVHARCGCVGLVQA